MKNRPLSAEIVAYIHKRTGKTEGTVRKDISLLRRSYSGLPINCVAQIYALENSTSVLQKLTSEEKQLLPNLDIQRPPKIVQQKPNPRKDRVIQFVKYSSTDIFVQAHVDETNRAYTYRCYTAAFILCRKMLENLLTDLIRKKYPKPSKDEVELFFDTAQGRTKDFSIILINLSLRIDDFGTDKKLLQRIIQLSDKFKDDANDKTHSWYHIVRSRKELDDTNFQDIIDLIKVLEEHQFSGHPSA